MQTTVKYMFMNYTMHVAILTFYDWVKLYFYSDIVNFDFYSVLIMYGRIGPKTYDS